MKCRDLSNLLISVKSANTGTKVFVPVLVPNQSKATVAVVFEKTNNSQELKALECLERELNQTGLLHKRKFMQELEIGIRGKVMWALSKLRLSGCKAPVEVELNVPEDSGAKASIILTFNSQQDRQDLVKCLNS